MKESNGRYGLLAQPVSFLPVGVSMREQIILVIENHPEILELILVSLEYEPYQILTANNMLEGLRQAKKHRPDLILLEVAAPGRISGLRFCQILKQDPHLQDLRITILTSRGQDADKRAGFAAGADEYIVKPFSPGDLIQCIKQLLG